MINDYSALFDEIIALLSLFDEEEEEREEEEEELMISDDTYCSSLFIKLISSGVRELCYRRIKALFDILLICELLDQSTSHHVRIISVFEFNIFFLLSLSPSLSLSLSLGYDNDINYHCSTS